MIFDGNNYYFEVGSIFNISTPHDHDNPGSGECFYLLQVSSLYLGVIKHNVECKDMERGKCTLQGFKLHIKSQFVNESNSSRNWSF